MSRRGWLSGAALAAAALLAGWVWTGGGQRPAERGTDSGAAAGPESSPRASGAPVDSARAGNGGSAGIPRGPRLGRLIVQSRSQLPVGPLQDFIEAQRAAAEAGSADAAYRLGLALKECSLVPAARETLEQAVLRMYQTRRFNDLTVENPERMAGELRRRFERCEGVPAAARQGYYDWMLRAADAGSLEALESMSFQLPPDGICRERELESCGAERQAGTLALRERQAAWLRRARQLGSANALWQLGGAYLNGEMLEPDSIEAYAHLRAYQLVMQSFGAEDPIGGLVAELRERLRTVEVTQAELRARELIDNPRCCVYVR